MRKLFLSIAVVIMLCGSAFADEAKLKELYSTYGELQIRAEIIQGQTNQVKQAIAQALQQPVVEKVEAEKKAE